MSNFNQRDQNSDKQDIEISPAKNQKLNGIQKIYHWANLIIIPIILVVVLIPDRFGIYGKNIITIGFMYLVISGLINDMTRGWLFEFNRVAHGIRLAFSWIGQLFFIFVILGVVIGAAGTLILIPVLWIASLKVIIRDITNQTGNSIT